MAAPTPAAPLVDAQGVSKAYGAQPLFSQVNLAIGPHARIGLIGDNGAGKSTFLGVLDGTIEPDAGKVIRRGNATLERLAQAPHFGDLTVFAALASALAVQRAAIAAFEAGSAGPNAEGLMAEVERLGGWEWQHRLERAAQELDLGDLQRRCSALSGGYNKRVALARLMLNPADVLLLDEPTNHLDVETITWLERWLQTAPQAVVVVTHDRTFLDQTASTMAELQGGRLNHYTGNYSDYLVARAEREALEARSEHRARQHLRHELAWARKSPQARTTKNRARLDRVEAAAASLGEGGADPRLSGLQLSDSPRLGNEVLVLDAATVQPAGQGGAPLFAPLTLRLCAGERWGVVGPNGVGKTSLLRLVAGTLPATTGKVTRGKNTQAAYFDQHRTALDPNRSVMQTLVPDGGDRVYLGGKAQHVAQYLERFGFPADARMRRVAELSGGEKNRLALALFLLTPANLLLLDEPTNDLDLTTLAVLEQALVDFPGCMLVVSHDRAFLDRITTGIVGLQPAPEPGAPAVPEVLQGDYSTYAAKVLAVQAAQNKAKQAQAKVAQEVQKAAGKAGKQARKAQLSGPEKRELAAMETTIETLETKLAATEAGLGDARLWQEGGEAGRALQEDAASQKAAVEAAYARWEVLLQKEAAP